MTEYQKTKNKYTNYPDLLDILRKERKLCLGTLKSGESIIIEYSEYKANEQHQSTESSSTLNESEFLEDSQSSSMLVLNQKPPIRDNNHIQLPDKVFIVYSWDSEEHKSRVAKLARRLREQGIDCELDLYYETCQTEGLESWMIRQVDEADFVIAVCTEKYEQRFRGKEQFVKSSGVHFEAEAIRSIIKSGEYPNKFITVTFSERDCRHIPLELRHFYLYKLYKDHEDKDFNLLYRRLTNQPSHPKPPLGSPVRYPPIEI